MRAEGWEQFRRDGEWAPPSLDAEGFVHCTAGDDVMLSVANAFYRDEVGDFVVLSLDPAAISAPIRWELPPSADPMSGTRFPHVYGPLNLGAVVSVRRVQRDRTGAFTGYAPTT